MQTTSLLGTLNIISDDLILYYMLLVEKTSKLI